MTVENYSAILLMSYSQYFSFYLKLFTNNFLKYNVYLADFGHTHSMRKFPGQRSNPYHRSDLSFSSDTSRSLTHSATRERLSTLFHLICSQAKEEVPNPPHSLPTLSGWGHLPPSHSFLWLCSRYEDSAATFSGTSGSPSTVWG